jgi:hypothetical protein
MSKQVPPTLQTAAVRCGALLAILATSEGSACRRDQPSPRPTIASSVSTLQAARMSPGAYGRAGDLMLEAKPFGVLTFATQADPPGHRQLRGAIVDVGLDTSDRADPLRSWRPGWQSREGAVHLGPMALVEPTICDGAKGVHVGGDVDGVHLDTTVCPTPSGYRATTSAQRMPEGGVIIDEVNAGTAYALGQDTPRQLDGERTSPFLGVGTDDEGWLLEGTAMNLRGRLIHIAEDFFRAPFVVRHAGISAVRDFRVVPGDGFALLEQVAGAHRKVQVAIEGESGRAAILDDEGGSLISGAVPLAGRTLSIPVGVGAELVLYDRGGVEAGHAVIDSAIERLVVKPPRRAQLSLHVTDDRGGKLPVHVLLRGLGGTPDPTPVAPAGAFAAGRSLYLVDGAADVELAPGRYRVTVTHGVRYTLSVTELELGPGEQKSVDAALRDVYPEAAWTSGDFHLHAMPSPDAPVSLEARVATLACEGLDLAVATDHNHITDYGPAVERLGLGSRIVTLVGDEITSYGRALWGHFNLYPLPVPQGDPEEAVPPYFDIAPSAIFAAARAGGGGGRILQINHPRMDPNIGYFDLTHLDAKTGRADDTFSGNFDAVEVYNGFWVSNPGKVREGAVDLVALARRGIHVAATGNSDSHRLLYEEAGYPRTFVHVPAEPRETRAERVLAAIRRGDTTVTSGPLVEMTVDGLPIGSTVVPKGGRHVRVHVRVTAPAWIPVEHVEVWHDDKVAFHADVTKPPVDGVRYEGEAVLDFPTDGTVLAWATADSPLPDVLPSPSSRATGFTGLVYVDADGDGKVVVPPRP